MTRLKICGLKRPEDIEYINISKPDYCGFIVNFPKSHRSVTPEYAELLIKHLDEKVSPVGVFVDSPVDIPATMVNRGVLGIVQLHGTEDNNYISELKKKCDAVIIKAFTVNTPADIENAKNSIADYILLDKGKGEGLTFDWSLIKNIDRPYFLAGGLNTENLKTALSCLNPYAVDLSSGVETDKLKDFEKIKIVKQIITEYNKGEEVNV